MTLTGITSTTTSGGTVTVNGTNFMTGTGGAPMVMTVKVSQSSVVSLSALAGGTSTSFQVLVPALAAGDYDVLISTQGCSELSFPAILHISSVATPSTTLGADLIFWASGAQLSGSTLSDLSSYAQNATCTGVTQTASDANFNSQATLAFDGTTSHCTVASFSMETGTTPWIFAVTRETRSASSGDVVVNYHDGGGTDWTTRYQSNKVATIVSGTGLTGFFGDATTYLNTSIAWYGYVANGSLLTLGLNQGPSINNESTLTGPNIVINNTGTLNIGEFQGGTQFLQGTIAEIVIARTKPSTAQFQAIYKYEDFKYAIDTDPSLDFVTTMQTTGGLIRLHGSSYWNGATIASPGAFTSTATTFRSSKILEATVTAGTYTGPLNVNILNPDNRGQTFNGALKTTATQDPWAIYGSDLVYWGRADTITSPDASPTTGSAVSGLPDLSGMGQSCVQSTSGNRPTWNSANANFNSQPSIHFGGSQYLTCAAFDYLSATYTGELFMWIVVRAPAPASTGSLVSYRSTNPELRIEPTGKPDVFVATVSATWGSSISNLTSGVFAFGSGLNTATATVGVNVGNGVDVTNSGSATATTNGGTFAIGARADGTSSLASGDIAEVIVVNTAPTGTQKTNTQTYLHNRYGI